MNCARCGKSISSEGLCISCGQKFDTLVDQQYKQFTGHDKIKEGMSLILQGLSNLYGLDSEDVNFKDTPARVARAYSEIFAGIKDTDKQVAEILATSFPSNYNQIVLASNVKAYSMCPHHFLPVEYTMHIAYLPSYEGQVLGISKLARLAIVLAKRPVLQEQLTRDITEALSSLDGCEGSACIIAGKHYCMIMRGAKQGQSVTITSSLRGAFKENLETRQELMNLIKINGGFNG